MSRIKPQTPGRVHVPERFEENLKRLTMESREAARYLVHAELSERTLEELSEVVDHLRATVWAVLNSLVDEFSDGQRARLVLTSHRIQRAQTLLEVLNDEIETRRITGTTPGTPELLAAMGRVYKKLHYLSTGKAASEGK